MKIIKTILFIYFFKKNQLLLLLFFLYKFLLFNIFFCYLFYFNNFMNDIFIIRGTFDIF
jgi:hypothetical protein